MSADEIFARFERTGNVAVVTMDRPPVNAVSFGFMRSILENIEAAAASDASVVILTSALPGVFCAGADLREHLDEVEHAERAGLWRRLLEDVRTIPVPLIAAVRGACIGGGIGLVSQCDIRIASPSASFSLPEVRVGRAGGATHLRRLVSEGRVRSAMFTGRSIDADTARDWGLVDLIVAETEWPAEAVKFAEEVATPGRAALVLLKQALDASEDAGTHGYAAEQAVTEAMRRHGIAVTREA